MKVIVVGAGIIGASIAWNLSRAGADVIVVQSGAPAASSASFGWINASFFADEDHHRLRVASIAAYGRLRSALPDAPIKMGGALWWEEQGAGLQQMKATLEALDYPVEELREADLNRLEPDMRGLPNEALRFGDEGWCDPAAMAVHLLGASTARVLNGVSITGISVAGGVVCGVETSVGHIQADRVVVAAGNGAPAILASVDVALPMLTRPGVLVTSKPVRAKLNHVSVTPNGEMRQLSDGRLLASAVASHQGDDASEVTENSEEIAQRVLAWLTPLVADETVDWDEVTLAYRPVPSDGLPVIGAVGPQGLHVAVMHSGVTLAAIVGEAVAAEVAGNNGHADLLTPYRPQRFQ